MGIEEMAKELEKLNPGIQFKVVPNVTQLGGNNFEKNTIIAGCTEIVGLNLPNGYYYNSEKGITNMHNVCCEENVCFEFMTLFKYLSLMV